MSEYFKLSREDWNNIVGPLFNSIGSAAEGILYRAGKEAGKRIGEQADVKSDGYQSINEITEELGWGEFSFDMDKGEGTVQVENSFELEAADENHESLDFLRGVVAGVVAFNLGREVEANYEDEKIVVREREWEENMDDVMEAI